MCWKGQSHSANGVIQMQKCASVTAESFRLRLKCLKKKTRTALKTSGMSQEKLGLSVNSLTQVI